MINFQNQIKKIDFTTLNYKQKKNERLQQIEAVEIFEQQQKKNKKRTKLIDFADRKSDVFTNQKVKSLIDFDEQYSCSIRSIAIEKTKKVNLTTRFLNRKMLMFSKVSIKSFAYDLIDIFMFPNQEIKDVYKKYQVEKCYVYQNLTDTDSTSVFFVFICDLRCL